MSKRKNEKKLSFRRQIIGDLNDIIDNGKSFAEKCAERSVNKDFYYDYYRKNNTSLLKSGLINKKEYDEFNTLYETAKNSKAKKPIEKIKDEDNKRIKTDKVRSSTEFIDFEGHKLGKIIYYTYEFVNRFGVEVRGQISREDMDSIYSLYSYEGMNQSQRQVSRHFLSKLDMDFYTFKKLLNAFNITKKSMPFSPHILEEESLRECVDRTFIKKEEKYFKRLEGDRVVTLEKKIQSLLDENNALKSKQETFFDNIKESFSSETDIVPYTIKKVPLTKEEGMFIYLSDCHVGADVSSDSIYNNEYNEREFHDRLVKILDRVKMEYEIRGRFDAIYVVNLGDALDGYNGQTTRKTHHLPQNMSNKNQLLVFAKEIQWFVDTLHSLSISNNVGYISVGCSNHGGEWEWACNKIIETYFNLKYPQMFVKIFDKFIDYVNYGKHTIILTHGKDDIDMKFGMPLNLDNKTELYINEFIDNHDITNKSIYFVKGDLHQSSVSPSKRFIYKNVGSIFGGSKWVATNYGKTKPVCDYQIFNRYEDYILDNKIVLK